MIISFSSNPIMNLNYFFYFDILYPPEANKINKYFFFSIFQMNSRDDNEKSYKVSLPDNAYATVYLREAMSVEEFLASACARKNLNAMEHFVRVKKRREMEDHNYFVPHRNDLIETYVSIGRDIL